MNFFQNHTGIQNQIPELPYFYQITTKLPPKHYQTTITLLVSAEYVGNRLLANHYQTTTL